jgi:GAF domain-containing protein
MIAINKQFNLVFDENLVQVFNTQKFPFKCTLSFSPFIDFWNQTGSWDQAFKAPLIKKVREELEKAPELLGSIEDLSILEKHRELIDMLMTLVFPPAFWDRDYLAAIIPYHFRIFYATPSFERFLMENKNFIGRAQLDEQAMTYGTLLKAYIHILQKFYHITLEFEYPLIFTAQDSETGLDRHFKFNFDTRFCEVRKIGEIKPLTDEEKKYLLNNLADLKTWMELIPPENFEFHGFTVITATDVTDQEVLSSLKRDLIDRESIVSNKKFRSLQEKLRTLFRLPDLVLGLAALQGDQVFLINYGRKLEKCCIFSDSQHFKTSDFAGSIYERSVRQGNLLIIEDLVTYPHRSPVEDQILAQGIRSIIIAPLYYQDRLIGTLELGSPNPGELNALNALKLREVLPVFSVAVNRSMEELDNRIQAIIKKKYTAIHPSVDWRFRKAVLNYIEKRNRGLHEEIEQIVFDNVYPLFGATDIRGSSMQRNEAIQADLIEYLTLVREIILLAANYKPLPIFNELVYRIDNKIAKIEVSLSSGDEVTLLDFLRREVEPLFETLKDFGPGIQDKIQAYRSALDPQLGIIYRKRKDFEESVARINDTISDYLDEEEEKAQAMFPHYFEKHKTDGVDHSIYIGASLVEDGKFDLLYLKNLRLWQLMTICGIAWKTEQLKGSLKLPLETTHLILVQNMPMSIRFRIDEKQFDVDGAYNIRYEIVKKRIDKAMIKGGNERLTQPAKIAIVYSQPKEAQEYRQYIEYLQASGYLTGEIEDLELEDLQGIQGLKALRVTVNFQPSIQGRGTLQEEVREVLQAVN